MGFNTSFSSTRLWSCTIPVTFVTPAVTDTSVLPPFILEHGVQYLTVNNGDRLKDQLGIVCPKPNVCDIPCVVFDDAGDHAEVTFPEDYTGDSVTDFEFKATFKQTILSADDMYEQELIHIPLADDPVGSYLIFERQFNSAGAIDEAAEFTVYYLDDDNTVYWDITAHPPASFDNKMITAKISFKNGIISCTVDGTDVPFTTNGPVGTIAKLHNKVTLCDNKQTDLTIKYLYMNLDEYEAEFKFEEGAGFIITNTKDSTANAIITSSSGIDIIRSPKTNQAICYNAKNGCCKISGMHYEDIPDDEFVYIPADENGIAQDPTMVPTIELSIDNINFYQLNFQPTVNNHGVWGEQGSPNIPPVLYGLYIYWVDGIWVLPGDNATLVFLDSSVLHNQYPPRGTFNVIDTDDGDKPYSLTIRYTHDNIDDNGNIISSNLNCMPAKIHNGANYLITEAVDATPAPTYSALYDNTGTPLRLHLSDFQAIPNGNKSTLFRFEKGGVLDTCHLEAIVVTEEHALDTLTPAQFVSLSRWMGDLSCGENIFIEANYGADILTSEGYYIVPRES